MKILKIRGCGGGFWVLWGGCGGFVVGVWSVSGVGVFLIYSTSERDVVYQCA